MQASKTSNCLSHANILDLLDREDDLEAQASWLVHLETCADCRRSVDAVAADQADWDEAGELLSGVSFNLAYEDKVLAEEEPNQDLPGPILSVLRALAPTDDPQMLGRIGSYEVSGVIGSGGMGIVLKAHDRSLDRIVAIKVMAPHLSMHKVARGRFAREAKAAAAVLHPNVIAIHGVSIDSDLAHLVMTYVSGLSLQRRIDRDGPMAIEDVVWIGAQIAAGLAAAHRQGLVHRDIKPANILVEESVARVTLTDFGLARAIDDASATQSGVIAGTPQYMSPEQVRGEAVDARSDLFSLGSVLYAMLIGSSPFRAETSYGVMNQVLSGTPAPIRQARPDVPDWLCRLIDTLLAKSPGERWASAEDVERMLRQCAAHLEEPLKQSLPPELRRPRRWRSAIVSAGLVLTLVASGLAVSAWPTSDEEPTNLPRQTDQATADAAPTEADADVASAEPPEAATSTGEVQTWSTVDDLIIDMLEIMATELESDSRGPFE